MKKTVVSHPGSPHHGTTSCFHGWVKVGRNSDQDQRQAHRCRLGWNNPSSHCGRSLVGESCGQAGGKAATAQAEPGCSLRPGVTSFLWTSVSSSAGSRRPFLALKSYSSQWLYLSSKKDFCNINVQIKFPSHIFSSLSLTLDITGREPLFLSSLLPGGSSLQPPGCQGWRCCSGVRHR